jgi:hypothetical protein
MTVHTPGELHTWTDDAALLIKRRMRDARSHAEGGYLPDAEDRLSELRDGLVAHLHTARETFYLDAWPLQRKILDPAIVADVGPNLDETMAAVRQPILDVDQTAELEDLVERARRELLLTVGVHAGNDLMLPIATAGWEQRHRDALTTAVTLSLSNAQVALYHAVGRLLIKPELR